MRISEFKMEVLSKNQWDLPIDLDPVDFTPVIAAVELITTGHSTGIQPVFLKNLSFFKSISTDEWRWIIIQSFLLEDKHMMGMINFVDTCYKYIDLDLRGQLMAMDYLDGQKRKFIIDYFRECPFCLEIENDERESILRKYNVNRRELSILKERLGLI